jgi:transcriptional regulator with XRE-family HTH domain
MRHITPSGYVGSQVRKFRRERRLSQQGLADRLRELEAVSTGWSQTKINKLERGRLTRILVDDVFELALALDVSPLYLLTPSEVFDESGNTLKVWLGGRVSRWPAEVRQWIRGMQPILENTHYHDDEAYVAAQLFYLLSSQPAGEASRIAEGADFPERVHAFVAEMLDRKSEEQHG